MESLRDGKAKWQISAAFKVILAALLVFAAVLAPRALALAATTTGEVSSDVYLVENATDDETVTATDTATSEEGSLLPATSDDITFTFIILLASVALAAFVYSRKLALAPVGKHQRITRSDQIKKNASFAVSIVVAFALIASLVSLGTTTNAKAADTVTADSKILATYDENRDITVPTATVTNNTDSAISISSATIVSEYEFVSDWTSDAAGQTVKAGESLTVTWTPKSAVDDDFDGSSEVKVGSVTYIYNSADSSSDDSNDSDSTDNTDNTDKNNNNDGTDDKSDDSTDDKTDDTKQAITGTVTITDNDGTLVATIDNFPSDATATYVWYDEDGNKIGEGSSYVVPDDFSGKVTVKVTDEAKGVK